MCGHQSSTSRTLTLPRSRVFGPSRSERRTVVASPSCTTHCVPALISPSISTSMSSIPVVSSTVVRSRRDVTRNGNAGVTVMGRQGPTGAGRGDQPGMRPSNVVRYQRRFDSLVSRVRQRARGLRCLAKSGFRARQRMKIVVGSARSSSSRSCESHIDSLVKTC